ncbi:MAG: CapA family protein [Candidatus Komeilibacteria bacterium]|nr:CapA family protein [Candidatus Komeilibacteria bacterium]
MKKSRVISIIIAVLAVSAGYLFFSQQKQLKIFSAQQSITVDQTVVESQEPLPELPKEVSLVAVGDIMLSRVVGQKMVKNGYDYPFAKLTDFLSDADLTFGNLETAITPGRRVETGEFMFRADAESATALKRAGFDIVSLANNHSPNFGAKGLEDTFKYLNDAGVKYVGAGNNQEEANQPVYLTTNGLTLAFLAYNDDDVVPAGYEAGQSRAGTAFMRIEAMQQAVTAAKAETDFVIVSMHSGTEYVSKGNSSQIAFARGAIDAGAELVIGHHPHVVQNVEKYNGKYIFYSLGNFIFDQMWSQETREGLAVKIFFNRDGVDKISLHPVLISDYSQPALITDNSGQSILKRLNYPFTNNVITD